MTHVRTALMSVVAIVATVVLTFWLLLSIPQPVQAEGQGCIIDVSGTIGVVVCGGEVVDQLPLPTVKVTERVVDEIIRNIPGPTVRVPGPTETVTVRVREPGGTETVFVSGPTETVTIAGPTQTRTVTAEPEPAPTTTVTTTPSPTLTGQPSPDDDTMVPDDGPDFFSPDVDLGDDDTTIAEVGLGTLTLLALVGLLLLALYGGYILGYKDKERKDTNFMRAVLDAGKLRRTS